MSVVDVVWKGNCRSPEARYRLLGYLHRLALLSDGYLRARERPLLSIVGETSARPPRPNIEILDEVRKGPVFVSSSIAPHPDTLIARALEAGLSVEPSKEEGPQRIRLEEVRLRGIDFKLFDPRGAYSDSDRMSFVFLECPEHHFLDGRLVEVDAAGDATTLESPHLQLDTQLEDWTDCLFAWIRFFLMGDFWWRRGEELQGYADYRGVFEELQTSRGSAEAEDQTFDAVLSTYSQHAEHGMVEVQQSAKSGKV